MDSKIQNRVLQLGTLNDELKRVIGLTNERNAENAKLEEKKLELEESVAELVTELSKLKSKNASEEDRHREQIRALESTVNQKQKDVDTTMNFIMRLEDKESSLRENVKELKLEEKKLVGLRVEVTQLKVKKDELDELNSDLAKLKNEIAKQAEAFNVLISKYQENKKMLADEKSKHRNWLKDTNKKAEDELQKAKDSVATLLKTKRDLKVVERRLARKWKELYNTPFPKIYG